MQVLEPSKGFVLVRQTEKETQRGNFLVAEQSIESPRTATVEAVGKGSTYKIGETIVYKPYTTNEIKLNDIEYFLVNEEDVLGKVLEK